MNYGVEAIGRRSVSLVSRIGSFFILLGRLIASLRQVHRSFGLILEQLYLISEDFTAIQLNVFADAVADMVREEVAEALGLYEDDE